MKYRVSIGHTYASMDFIFDSMEEATVFMSICLANCTDQNMKIEIKNEIAEE